jgi:hypothetical protein
MGSVHHTWGLDISSGGTKEPIELSQKSQNGAIGLGAFKGRILLLDYHRRQLGIYPPGLPLDFSKSGWTSVGLKYDNEGAQIELALRDKKIRLILDTGANLSLLKPSSVKDRSCEKEKSAVSYCGTKDVVDLKTSDGHSVKNIKFIMAELREITADGILGATFSQCIE